MQKLIVDRFEGDYAVCETEDRNIINIPKTELPDNIREGNSIYLDKNGKYRIDIMNTNNQEEKIRKKMNKLWE